MYANTVLWMKAILHRTFILCSHKSSNPGMSGNSAGTRTFFGGGGENPRKWGLEGIPTFLNVLRDFAATKLYESWNGTFKRHCGRIHCIGRMYYILIRVVNG